MKKTLFMLLLSCATLCDAQERTETTLADDWLFSRDRLTWQQVSVPHDWAINGPFDKKHDLQFVAIEQNGETEKTEKSGRSGALPWIGEGHYRTTVTLPEGMQVSSAQPVNLRGEKAGEAYPVKSGKLELDLPKYAPASFILK